LGKTIFGRAQQTKITLCCTESALLSEGGEHWITTRQKYGKRSADDTVPDNSRDPLYHFKVQPANEVLTKYSTATLRTAYTVSFNRRSTKHAVQQQLLRNSVRGQYDNSEPTVRTSNKTTVIIQERDSVAAATSPGHHTPASGYGYWKGNTSSHGATTGHYCSERVSGRFQVSRATQRDADNQSLS